jgi:hypothetical protein
MSAWSRSALMDAAGAVRREALMSDGPDAMM